MHIIFKFVPLNAHLCLCVIVRNAQNTVCLPWTNLFEFLFHVLIGVLLKGMVERSLLSKDEILTPNIDKVMGV